MKKAQIILFSVALAAGGAASLLVSSFSPEPPPQPAPAAPPPVASEDVLVAARDLGYGAALKESDMQWRAWPKSALPTGAILKSQSPDAVKELASSMVRAPTGAGEPLRRERLVKGALPGLMASIVSPGKRAVAVDVTPNSTAGGFILPNDHVDIFVTSSDPEMTNPRGGDVFVTDPVLRDVHVLAIGQAAEAKSGDTTILGPTATLELDPHQVEIVMRAQRRGPLSLVLRRFGDADAKEGADYDSGFVTIVRSGAPVIQRLR